MPTQFDVQEIQSQLEGKSLPERLEFISEIAPQSVFTTSLGREDQVLLWHVANMANRIGVVTLNTGRLFPQTLELLNVTQERYGLTIQEFEPDPDTVAAYIGLHGRDGFYNSVAARKECCVIRKVEPLQRALGDAGGWVTGLTREQSAGRSTIALAEWDETYQLVKFNPMADVTSQEIAATIVAHDIPVNALHDRGYPSIGCEPCTRAIKPGEHPRAGRWWWEREASSECGLHVPAAVNKKQVSGYSG